LIIKNPSLFQVLIKEVVSVKPGTSLLKAREILLHHKLKRLVVLDSKKRPVGIITEKDIVKTVYSSGDKPIKSIRVGSFMSKNLVTVKKKASIYDCAKLMKNRKISSIIVLNDNGMLAGLVTKTELASVFLTQATDPLKISKIMTRKVITAMPGDSLLFVENLLINNRVSRIVIQRNRKPVGVITIRDFIPAKLPLWISESADPKEVERFRKGARPHELDRNQMSYLLLFKAVDIMSSNPIIVDADEDVGMAVLLMIRNGISGLPVVKNSKLVGIITKADIVKAIAEK
jgi:CBS domain-containing protein